MILLKKIVSMIFLIFIIALIIPFLLTPKYEEAIKEEKKATIKEEKEEKKVELPKYVSVYITEDEKTSDIEIEEYVKGVVGTEMPVNFDIEALKAQAIAARTLAVANYAENSNKTKLDDTVSYQAFSSKDKILNKWNSPQNDEYWSKIEKAVNDTKGEVIYYKGDIIKDIKYFSTSSGKTEKSIDVFGKDEPYLISTESPGEENAPKYKTEKVFSKKEFVELLNTYFKESINQEDPLSEIKILNKTDAGSVKEIKIKDIKAKGTDVRKALSLNSANFTLEYKGDEILVKCVGYGHGVGMSQWGANAMAKEGYTYNDILKHYYKGIEIKKIK